MKKETIKLVSLVILVFTLLAYVPLRNYKQNDIKALISYFAGDAFYYLNIAEKSLNKPFFTNDGINPTNGFQPLWEYFISFSFRFLENQEQQLLFVFFINIVFLSIGLAWIALTLYRKNNNWLLSIFGLVPGIFYLLFAFFLNQHGSAWSFINGMESSLSIMLFGFLLYVFIKNRDQALTGFNLLLISLLLTLITLTRFDDVFLFIPFGIYLIIAIPDKRLKKILIASIFPLVIIGSYLFYNLINYGFPLPVSGLNKSGFHFLNILHLINSFTINISINDLYGQNLAQRVLPLIVPLIAGIWAIRKYHNSEGKNFIHLLGYYVVAKSIYHLLFVNLWDQGHWYFTLNIIWLNVFIISILAETRFFKSLNLYKTVIILLFVILIANNFIELNRFGTYKPYFEFWNNKEKIKSEFLKSSNTKGIIEYDDGIISYSLNLPAISGFGLAIDRNAYNALKSGSLLDTAYNRGFNVLTSLCYFKRPTDIPDSIKSVKDFTQKPFFAFDNQNTDKWQFKLLYADKNSGVVFIGFKPKL